MRERNLTVRQIKTFIANADSVEPSVKDPKRFLVKKLYYHPQLKRQHLLMAICEQEREKLVIITIIDTSQVKKYS